ncbi:MAG: hypothetical protein NDI94_02470 [Candidatus Woesearchaeota archaeon]|nr:hypothetical protein [Candidatus Woesearchaeota archaeon]
MPKHENTVRMYVSVDEQQYILELNRRENMILIAGAQETDGLVAWADENGLVRESMDDSSYFRAYKKKTVAEAYSEIAGCSQSIDIIAKTSGLQRRCILPIMDKEAMSLLTYNLRWGFTYNDISDVMLGKNIRIFSYMPKSAVESYCYAIRTDAASEFLDMVRKSL